MDYKVYDGTEDVGAHNANLAVSAERLIKGNTYKDLSTVCVIPTRGMIHARVVQSWFCIQKPMNQKFTQIFMTGMEVGDAYNAAIRLILAHPEMSKWKYILSLEEDNLPPHDGLLKLFESVDKYDVVGGLYWTKGEEGQPMIYGDPGTDNYIPQVPKEDTIQECNGMGMGFNLFKMDLFRELPDPWFKTTEGSTQDLYFYKNLKNLGKKIACDTRVRIGHFSVQEDKVW